MLFRHIHKVVRMYPRRRFNGYTTPSHRDERTSANSSHVTWYKVWNESRMRSAAAVNVLGGMYLVNNRSRCNFEHFLKTMSEYCFVLLSPFLECFVSQTRLCRRVYSVCSITSSAQIKMWADGSARKFKIILFEKGHFSEWRHLFNPNRQQHQQQPSNQQQPRQSTKGSGTAKGITKTLQDSMD